MRSRYWSNSKFADWLRGTPSPSAETSKGWKEWKRRARAAHPIRYWIAETGLDALQNFVMYVPDRLHAIKYYINNRWITRTHALTASPSHIPPGTWHDVGYRFLPCLFNELVEFVEVELAWFHVAWDAEARAKYQTPWWATGRWRWRTWRSAAAGLDNLMWQMNLTQDWLPDDHTDRYKPTRQAEAAKEIHDLYHWWVVERPLRPDPMEASGWSRYCNERRNRGDGWLDDDDEEGQPKVDTRPMLDMMNEMEARYEAEDEAMMIRLIKIRQALWT